MYILRAPDRFLLLVVVSFRSSVFYPGGMMTMVMGAWKTLFFSFFFSFGSSSKQSSSFSHWRSCLYEAIFPQNQTNPPRRRRESGVVSRPTVCRRSNRRSGRRSTPNTIPEPIFFAFFFFFK